MLYKFTAVYQLDGKQQKTNMEYKSEEIAATLRRRLLTAFPNATSISIDPAHKVVE